ncbi:MAG: rhodanese-like domain-containing protein [Chloroflexi bacterium]|nr:rhodanese-like domain-containing protein [Chloroflexota bacterium]
MKKTKNKPIKKKIFPTWGWIVLGVILLAIIGLIVVLNVSLKTVALPQEITVAQAAKLHDQGAFILDVREPSEWIQFHIAGAKLIPLGELPNRLNEVPKDQTVVVVCRTGHRSAQGRDILLNAGYTHVTSMTGGLTEWQAQGMPTVSGQ